jgi:uncharacterized membrane protein
MLRVDETLFGTKQFMNPQDPPVGREFIGRRAFLISSILIVVIAATLRFHDLPSRSLWFDEAIAANNSRISLAATLANTRSLNSAPISYPLILYAAQELDATAATVRLPAAIAGTLAVIAILAFSRVGIDRGIALIAGLIFALSPTQVRYSQEVREYALAVLVSVLMMHGLLGSLRNPGTHNKSLYITLLVAPFVQYGLILFGAAIVAALALEGTRQYGLRRTLRRAAIAAITLIAGSTISYVLTLRYQLSISSDWWYLQSQLYEGRLYNAPKILEFLRDNTYRLLMFTANGLVVVLALPAFGVMLWRSGEVSNDQYTPSRIILSLLAAAIGIVAAGAILGIYPYGGIRQCIFLTPLIVMAIASSFGAVLGRKSQRSQTRWFAVAVAIVLFAGAADLRLRSPYGEREDIKTVLSALEKSATDKDVVYVYWGAKPALDFYGAGKKNFLYGTYHKRDPAAHVRDFHRLVAPDTDHVWIVFSHVNFEEDGYILEHLGDGWIFERRADATGASLYFATRRAGIDR